MEIALNNPLQKGPEGPRVILESWFMEPIAGISEFNRSSHWWQTSPQLPLPLYGNTSVRSTYSYNNTGVIYYISSHPSHQVKRLNNNLRDFFRLLSSNYYKYIIISNGIRALQQAPDSLFTTINKIKSAYNRRGTCLKSCHDSGFAWDLTKNSYLFSDSVESWSLWLRFVSHLYL